jgi:ATP-dependent Clp endopeptidase proteolytic subunit ClpP
MAKQEARTMKKWFEIKNKAEKAEIWVYEQIGVDWWTGDGMTAKAFQKELAGINASQIDLHINSPGGEVFDGITIYNLLKQHKATVTTYIDGLAASIASVVALAGDTIIMAENALMMIHNPWGMAMGDSADMRKMADELDIVSGSIAKAYISKTGKNESDIVDMMDAETWMTADEALEMGFIDQITEKMDMAACVKFVPTMVQAKFKHIPEKLGSPKQTPENERDFEAFLRDAGGFTRKEAKSIVADGFKGLLRDAVEPEEPVQEPEVLRDAEQPETTTIGKPIVTDPYQNAMIQAQLAMSQRGQARTDNNGGVR